MNRVRPLSAIGLLLLGVLNVVAALALYRSLAVEEPSATAAPTSTSAASLRIPEGAAVALLPIDAFTQIISRPVFFKSRSPWTPPPIAVAPPVEGAPQPNVETSPGADLDATLRAVVIAGTVHKALISTPQQQEGSWVKQGEVIGGWRLIALSATSATFKHGDRQRKLMLYTDDSDLRSLN